MTKVVHSQSTGVCKMLFSCSHRFRIETKPLFFSYLFFDDIFFPSVSFNFIVQPIPSSHRLLSLSLNRIYRDCFEFSKCESNTCANIISRCGMFLIRAISNYWHRINLSESFKIGFARMVCICILIHWTNWIDLLIYCHSIWAAWIF